ncbi:hypothetical protein B0T26DRAFT_670689 [Lasiosphaeria miniovina]|uniref:Uncharacterized protein n=1 Tax=Lasiosphaeria miniovina TaxID=1954250 RepID=A0AA40BHP7_9PEZI|nr:uncharacterized protein B0T26DRAFT_670689 [Lasiosphaeria miniovina]KAK0734384.1 hypothetical protein B0T26DRAFT_670689 [Lasiosphaeria miniovina]
MDGRHRKYEDTAVYRVSPGQFGNHVAGRDRGALLGTRSSPSLLGASTVSASPRPLGQTTTAVKKVDQNTAPCHPYILESLSSQQYGYGYSNGANKTSGLAVARITEHGTTHPQTPSIPPGKVFLNISKASYYPGQDIALPATKPTKQPSAQRILRERDCRQRQRPETNLYRCVTAL